MDEDSFELGWRCRWVPAFYCVADCTSTSSGGAATVIVVTSIRCQCECRSVAQALQPVAAEKVAVDLLTSAQPLRRFAAWCVT